MNLINSETTPVSKRSFLPSFSLSLTQVNLYIQHQLQIAISSMLLTCLLSCLIWKYFSHTLVVVWFLVGCVISLFRATVFSFVDTLIVDRHRDSAKIYLAFVVVCMSGIYWGVVNLLFLDDSHFELFAFVMLAISGTCVFAMASHAACPIFFILFLCLALTPMIMKMLLLEYYFLALLCASYFVALVGVSRNLSRAVLNSLSVDKTNTVLLKEAVEARAEAERANSAKSRFLTTASHDLRQPLHSIILLIRTLQNTTKDIVVSGLLEKLQSSSNTMLNLFDSILDLSQLDADVIHESIQRVDIAEMAESIASSFRPQASDKNIAVRIQYSPSKEEFGKIFIMADPLLLERCINNLVHNAVKFTDVGEVRIVLNKTPAHKVSLAIEDTGVGIGEKDLNSIFKEFSQVEENERHHRQGLGLGLSIVQRLADKMQVPVAVASKLGVGTQFSLLLNMAEDQSETKETAELGLEQTDISGLNVLVVDDDVAIQESMAALLSSWGCKPFCASNPAESIAQATAAVHIDAMLVDFSLRNHITGVELISQLYSADIVGRPPALVITGDTSVHTLNQLNAVDFPYTHKPVKPMKVQKFLRGCVRA